MDVKISFFTPADPVALKSSSPTKIPKKIFQTWKTSTVKPSVSKVIEELKQNNPEYEYYFFSDSDCQDYLLANYGNEYLVAFNKLKPGAFKADFWRYALLAKEGGVYIDLDMKMKKPLRELIDSDTDFYVVKDIPHSAIYQAFVAVVPNHPVLIGSTEECYKNIINDNMGDWVSDLSVTGPTMMGKIYSLYYTDKENSPISDYSNKTGEKIQMATNATFGAVVTGNHPVDGPYHGEVIIQNKVDEYEPQTQYNKMFHTCDIYKNQDKKKCMVKKYYGIAAAILFFILLFILIKLFQRNPCSVLPCRPPRT